MSLARCRHFLCLLVIAIFYCAVEAFHVSRHANFYSAARRSASTATTTATRFQMTMTTTTATTNHLQETRMPMLDEWRVLSNGSIEGRVINHPEIEDWAVISTSPLIAQGGTVALDKNGIVVETSSGSKYRLLQPSYEMRFAKDGEVEVQLDREELSKLQKVMKNVKQRGVRGAITYTGWEVGFWSVSLPLCIVAFRQLTGHWPDVMDPNDLEILGAEAFIKFSADRFAFPLRIGLAVGTSDWGQRNIVDRLATRGSRKYK